MAVVFIVNGDLSVREGLASVIRSAGWRCETFSDAQAFLQQPRAQGPACLVLDAELPDMSGLDLQSRVAHRVGLPVIFTAKCPVLRAAVLAMKAGAVEFLSEPPDPHLLSSAVRAALDRSRAALAREAEVRSLGARYESLSAREREVMSKIVVGHMNKIIATDLGISVITVKAHRGKVMRKMQAASLPDLVNMAARLRPILPAGDDKWLSSSITTAGGSSGALQSPWPLRLSPACP